MPTPGNTTQRGYGYQHQQIREAVLDEAYGKPCHLCGQIMRPDQALHLDHDIDRRGYRGMTHADCNRRDGAKRGAQRRRSKSITWTTTRQW